MYRTLFTAIFIVIAIVTANTASAKVYYMRADGTAGSIAAAIGPLTSRASCMSIENHNKYHGWASTLKPGDIVKISDRGGVYTDNLTVLSSGQSGNPITYEPVAGENPVINLGGTVKSGILIHDQSWININGPIKVRNSGEHGVLIRTKEGGANRRNIYVSNITAENSKDKGFHITGKGFSPGSAAWIENVEIRDCTAILSGQNGFAATRNARNILFKNCTSRQSGQREGGHGYSVGNLAIRLTWSPFASGSIGTYRSNQLKQGMTITRLYSKKNYQNSIHRNGKYLSLASGEWDQNGRYIYLNPAGGNPPADNYWAQFADTNNIVFSRCAAIETKNSYPLEGHGFVLDDFSRDCTIEFSEARGNARNGINVHMGGGHIIKNNILRLNLHGLSVFGGSYNTEIYNNVFYKNTIHGIHILSYVNGIDVRNNIALSNDKGLTIDRNATSVVMGNNCSFSNSVENWYGEATKGPSDIEKNPLFVNAANGNFQLQSDSPCIDAGIDVGITSDFLGKPVPYNGVPDIGAYEWQPSDTTPEVPSDVQNLRMLTN